MKPSNQPTQTDDNDGWVTVASGKPVLIASTPPPACPKPNNKKKRRNTKRRAELPKNVLAEIEEKGDLLNLPSDVLSRGVLSFLGPQELLSLGACSKQTKSLCDQGYLWKPQFQREFSWGDSRAPVSAEGWKSAYQICHGGLETQMRCFHNRKTCVEDVLGVGLDFTVNPKKGTVDYISLSQDLLSQTAFDKDAVRKDAFENTFKQFLPLYFTQEHFERALPRIQQTIVKLCPERNTSKFSPSIILDVFPKIVNTFVVLLSDQGVSASQKSFDGLIRVHRLFLALAQRYPVIQEQAAHRLQTFIDSESSRHKSKCPNLGCILPLLMIVDNDVFDWPKLRGKYLVEMFDRTVLWICKEHPHLAKAPSKETSEQEDDRVTRSREAVYVSLRLTMFHVFFNKVCCKGSVLDRALSCDAFLMEPKNTAEQNASPTQSSTDEEASEISLEESTKMDDEPQMEEERHQGMVKSVLKHSIVSFAGFLDQVNTILSMNSWQRFFHFVGLKGPQSKSEMASLLRMHVHNSLRKKYHKKGMNFSRIHASGTSKILAKGQKYCVTSGLRRVIFRDVWHYEGSVKYLDATCLVYAGKQRVETVDYKNLSGCGGAIEHSGDVMGGHKGSHTIIIDLEALPSNITTLMFVISAWNSAKLEDILSPSISFRDSEAPEEAAPLCTYDLDKHDKISHLTSVIMCKLYRVGQKWHVLAIGDSHQGAADNYEPIYKAAAGLL